MFIAKNDNSNRKTNKRKYCINYTNSSNIINNNEYYRQFRWFVFFLRVVRRVFMNSPYMSECNFLNFSRESGNEKRTGVSRNSGSRLGSSNLEKWLGREREKKMILGHIYRPISFTCILISHNSLIYEWCNYNWYLLNVNDLFNF